uniref:Uncharacterized protein n=1 Tax=Bionectria ochroleuca TaxID=29856 RepID=A0A8H7KG02_BIOOC
MRMLENEFVQSHLVIPRLVGRQTSKPQNPKHYPQCQQEYRVVLRVQRVQETISGLHELVWNPSPSLVGLEGYLPTWHVMYTSRPLQLHFVQTMGQHLKRHPLASY